MEKNKVSACCQATIIEVNNEGSKCSECFDFCDEE